MSHVFSIGKNPSDPKVKEICQTWLKQEFPRADLFDGKSSEKWLDYFCYESWQRWKSSGYRQKEFLKLSFFGKDIIATETKMFLSS